jgi:hypothetical protein
MGSTTDEARRDGSMDRLMNGDAPAQGWAGALVAWAARYPRTPLWLALAAALVARVALVIHTGAVIDGDEALVGIQAEHILRGQFPVYFYGQSYMGSLETYLIAGVIAVTGPTAWALRAVPIALSLALVYLTWRLALALLPRQWRARSLLAGLAAMVAAVPPLYDAVTELRAWGGQIEVYVISLALLLATIELSQRLWDGAATGELVRRWAIWGFLAGLGFWINPLISYALVACGLWLAVALARRLAADRRAGVAEAKRSGLGALAATAGAALGGLPAWVYAIQTGGANIAVYLAQPQVTAHDTPVAAQGRLALAAAITRAYVTCAAPRVLDGSLPGEGSGWALARLALLALPVAGLLLALWLAFGRRAARADAAPRLGLPLLYAASVSAIFCLGTSAWPILKGCDLDLAGRYAAPLALVEPFLLLALFSAPLASAALRPATGTRALRGLWVAALVVLLAGGALQSASYSLASPQRTFQSPYYPFGMSDPSELLAYLRAHQIRAAWCNHWIGNVITYETNGRTVCADYYDQVYHHGLARPPDSIARVEAEPAPSFILNLAEPKPILALELDALGVPYTLAVLPRSGVTVITPERAVDPAKLIAGLAEDYGTNLHR